MDLVHCRHPDGLADPCHLFFSFLFKSRVIVTGAVDSSMRHLLDHTSQPVRASCASFRSWSSVSFWIRWIIFVGIITPGNPCIPSLCPALPCLPSKLQQCSLNFQSFSIFHHPREARESGIEKKRKEEIIKERHTQLSCAKLVVASDLQRGTCGVSDVGRYLIKFAFLLRGEDPLLKSLVSLVTGC